ncbi:MAG: flavodoxin family protein [Candidatus Wallbacteria bacterium HGW-Wallbacteria-1]|jgi:multimeric flavodoxin WrbA|uniref:Flavodoxin family protein n=1 Tax=Candidatus Wallbacteria bacterium HGW-Wallbacteria-1 TaxID=2013854 RepID=A0A2N1PQW4_9BACT|nr:MAG: flavodoxin family protein [Candidatus Wallbacteria bacterium HGW-Wallbacteria-1]
MLAVAVNGSPRKNGNTESLLKKVLKTLEEQSWETEFIQLGGKPIRGCMACSGCMKNRNMKCVVEDDCFNDVMDRMLKADAIILGSPTYFTDVSAEMKALLDRSGYVALANDCAFSGKIGAAVVAVRRGGAIHVYDTINHMFLMSRMVVPGSTYWNFGIGLKRGEVESDDEGMANMVHLGQSIAWLGKAIEPHKKDYPKSIITEE